MFGEFVSGLIVPLLSILFIVCFAHIRFRRLKWKGPMLFAYFAIMLMGVAIGGQIVVLAKYVKGIAGI